MKQLIITVSLILCLLAAPSVLSSCSGDGSAALTFAETENGYAVVSVKDPSKYVKIPREHNGKEVTAIAESAFYKDLRLICVEIPDTVRSVGAYAFADCSNLSEVRFSDGGSCRIGESAFENCTSLRKIDCSAVYSVETRAFANCTALRSLKDNGSLMHIGTDAFKNCEKLILYAPDDSYAHAYAVRLGIDTSFFASDTFSFIGIIAALAAGSAAVLITKQIVKRNKKRQERSKKSAGKT
ncbi:MAG: leucine-rich repeat domain-containing protein [Clostridia bacterium]|nr:leucine-rich repeat domain-containing protein [Clostridia bacterium]